MTNLRQRISRIAGRLVACLLGAAVSASCQPQPASASPFTTFADDEAVCRQAGSAAIGDASGPSAAQRYDAAYRRCMITSQRTRQMNRFAERGPPGPGFRPGNPHSAEFPDAFYSIPYATPGYGYDGFSY